MVVDTTNGTPTLVVRLGDSDNPARNQALDFVSGSGGRILRFEYVVQLGDRDSNGLAARADQLRLNGGTIRHATTGKDAYHDHSRPGNGNFGAHKVDGSLTPTSIKLCGARVGSAMGYAKEAELDLCWAWGAPFRPTPMS